nr:uncharacterized protein LOC123757090 [Procambarus clarkii]
MSEQVPQDGPPPGTPTRDLTPEPLPQEQDAQQEEDEEEEEELQDLQDSQELLHSGGADGGLSITDDNDDNRKMSEDSIISASPRGSPLLRPSGRGNYQDSDSCPSVSPSPDPDSRLATFDFNMIEMPVEGEAISAALQTERDFLDFMLSLPQVQKEGPGRPVHAQKESPGRLAQVQKEGPSQKVSPGQLPQEGAPQLRSEHRSPSRPPATVGGVVNTKVGLDHLDNLCRMMEQLGELREQNTRLQRRVHYLEELQTLQEMHRHLQETLEARRSGLGLGPIRLSDSDLHLDDDGDGGGGEMSRHGSEESLLLLSHRPTHKGKQRFAPTMVRSRSKSVGTDLLTADIQPVPKTKVSGWKRVIEALRWERALLLPPAPTPATATSAHHPTSPQPTPSPQPTTLQDPFTRPQSSSSSSSILTEVMTEEELNLYRQNYDSNQLLDLPESACRRHSSSEDDRRATTLDRDSRARPHDKEKKGHRSAWGKVKNMISTRRDSVRKKSTSSHRKSTVDRPGHDAHTGVTVEVSAASDPEDYDVDYDGVPAEVGEVGVSGGVEGSEGEWETGGVWTGPRETGGVWTGPQEESPVTTTVTSLGVRRAKPQLTITVPSSEDLTHLHGGGVGDRARPPHRSPEQRRRKISPSQLDPGVLCSLPMTPPSARRPSHWTKVKKAFLTTQQQQQHAKSSIHLTALGGSSSLPPSPSKKSSFNFDGPPHLGVMESSGLYDPDSPVVSLELSPDDLASHAHSTPTPSPLPHSTPSPLPHSTPSPQPIMGQHHHQHSGVLADLQKSLSGEFSRRLQEWEKLKGGAGPGVPCASGCGALVLAPGVVATHPEDHLPYEFRKKLHEWEKMKEREREKGKVEVPRGQEDVKTKIHGEDDLPADFRKKLTEWKIRKALVGQSQHNVEELQKNLGEEFNRKMAEWERIKASASHGHMKPAPGHPQVKASASAGNIQVKPSVSAGQIHKPGSVFSQSQVKTSVSASQVLAKPMTVGPGSSPRLDRKGSGHKIKKIKSGKTDKVPLGKAESGHKGRDKSDKELQWLEKELNKVERETQRLEREKEKFLERQARLEKMRQAMGQGGPAKKKEIYIKTSTGEFRFEGISQTFTKKLYEWEERRGIRPESSTIALLDPNYKAPEKEVQEKPKSPELLRLVRSKSESSMKAELVATPAHSHPSSLSLNEMETEDPGLQAENKAASEPTLAADDPSSTPKVAVLVQLEEVVDDNASLLHDPATPYAPAEITRNIDSSGSEEDVTRRRRAAGDDDDDDVVKNLRRSDSSRTEGSYRSLLHENMSLLDKLRQQEDLCRALETQMGDIDSKMDNVADQHLRTLGRCSLVSSVGRAFRLHKEHETEIAESLVQRIRELQDAGAEVNIHTVPCQAHHLALPPDHSLVLDDHHHEDLHDHHQAKDEAAPSGLEKETLKDELKIVEEEEEVERRESRPREHRKVKKAPPKKVQKLHNLTGDLLFQAKRLEQALVAKHGLERRGGGGSSSSYRQRSLRGRSSLRLAGDLAASPQRRGKDPSPRTWASIEAIAVPGESSHSCGSWEGSGGQQAAARAAAGALVSSRSFRGPSSATYSCDPQDLLAMNAELSRMAKELRVEMMKMWSFRDSTSPESETSEPLCVRGVEEDPTTGNERLVAEANEVFQSIALLHQDASPPSPHIARSPSSRSRRSPSTTSLSKRRESAGLEEKRSRRPVDDRDHSSTNSTPSRRDSSRRQQQQQLDEEQRHQKQSDVFLPAATTLGELLMRSQQEQEDEEEEEEEDEEEEERTWEGPRRRSSDGLSTVTSGSSRSHSPSPSIASSAPEAEASPRAEEEEEEECASLAGTWKTATTSTSRSAQHMLSSSFEWEEEESEDRKRQKDRWKAVEEEQEEETEKKLKGKWKTVADGGGGIEEQKSRGNWKAVVDEEGVEEKKPRGRWKAIVDDEEEVEEKKPKGRWKATVDKEEEVEEKKPIGRWKAIVDEEEEVEEKKPKGRWKAIVDEKEEEEEEEEKKPKGRWKAVVNEEEKVEKKPIGRWKAIVDEEEEEEEKKPIERWKAIVDEEDEVEEKKPLGRWKAVIDEEVIEEKKQRGRWNAVVDEEGKEEKKRRGRWEAATQDKEVENKQVKGSMKAEENEKEPIDCWREVVDEEGSKKKNRKGRWEVIAEEKHEKERDQKKSNRKWKAVMDENEKTGMTSRAGGALQTEVTSGAVCEGDGALQTEVTVTGARQPARQLRTRRISDTQVEYENYGQNNRDECFAYTFSRTVYDDEALTAGRLSRNPSVRRANSRDADDASWRRLRALPSMTDDSSRTDRSPDVFVPTKRTIFTVYGEVHNPEQARATPTFVDSQDDEQEAGTVSWRRSHSQPISPTENNSTPTTPLQKRRNSSKRPSRHCGKANVVKTGIKEIGRAKSENGAITKYSQAQTSDAIVTVKLKNQTDSLPKEAEREETRTDLNTDEMEVTVVVPHDAAVISNIGKEQTSEENLLNSQTCRPTSEAFNITVSLPEHPPSRQVSSSPLPTSTAITAALLHMSPPTSSPIESKKKVLEAVNEGVPAVRNIIQKFNQRITENQELLGSPFRSPPTSPPPWQSPRTQRKILAGLLASQIKQVGDYPQSNVVLTQPESSRSLIVSPIGGVLKSLSASVIASNPELPHQVQRSASGSLVQDSKSNTSEGLITTGLLTPLRLSKSKDPITGDVWSGSPSASPAISPVPTDVDSSYDLDLSVDDTNQLQHDRTTAAPGSRSPAAHLRALKIKKAKEEFLARGAAPLTTEQRLSGCHDPVKLRHRSGTDSTEDSWRESDDVYTGGPSPLPSPTPTEESSQDREETRDKPPRAASRRRNIPKKESFRRQSAGCLLEESASQNLSSQVVKSASSGVLGSGKRHSRYSVDSESPDRRKVSNDPGTESTKSSLGIFKLFRRNKNRDKKDMPSVQRLCRQSLLVDFANGKGRTQSASPQPRSDSPLVALEEVEGEDASEAGRSSKTLPRAGTGDVAPLAPSRSCPSSPVAPHRSRTANWLARGRQIFKSRSPSPSKKPR